MNHQDKRKAIMENEEQQPPLKKMATDGPSCAASLNSSPSHSQGETAAIANSGETNAGPSSAFVQMPDEIVSYKKGRRNEVSGRHLKTSALLAQVWKDELDSGNLLIKLFELFGESILTFIPAPEMSLFL